MPNKSLFHSTLSGSTALEASNQSSAFKNLLSLSRNFRRRIFFISLSLNSCMLSCGYFQNLWDVFQGSRNLRPIFDSHCNPTSMISSTHFVRDKNRRCSHDRRVLSVAKAKAALVFRVLVDSRTLPLKENECKDSNPCSAPVLWRFVANGFRLVTHSNFLSLSLSLPPYIFCFSLFLLCLFLLAPFATL